METFYRRLVTDEEVVPRELYRGINYVSLRAFIAFKIIYTYLISRLALENMWVVNSLGQIRIMLLKI